MITTDPGSLAYASMPVVPPTARSPSAAPRRDDEPAVARVVPDSRTRGPQPSTEVSWRASGWFWAVRDADNTILRSGYVEGRRGAEQLAGSELERVQRGADMAARAVAAPQFSRYA